MREGATSIPIDCVTVREGGLIISISTAYAAAHQLIYQDPSEARS